MGDQLVARPLPTQDSTNTEETHTDIHASSGIRNHDPSVLAGEDSSCLRPRGHCDRRTGMYSCSKMECTPNSELEYIRSSEVERVPGSELERITSSEVEFIRSSFHKWNVYLVQNWSA
jgi:hypothetical protein